MQFFMTSKMELERGLRSYRGPRFQLQRSDSGSQPTATPIPRHLIVFSGLCIWRTDMYASETPTSMNKNEITGFTLEMQLTVKPNVDCTDRNINPFSCPLCIKN